MSFLNGSSYASGAVRRAKQVLGDRPIDPLFIDGDHTYHGVAQDFLAYRRLVREGGLVASHDIVPDCMTRYGRVTGRWAGDVPRFWPQIWKRYEHREFVEDPQQDGLAIGVIRCKKGVDLPSDA